MAEASATAAGAAAAMRKWTPKSTALPGLSAG